MGTFIIVLLIVLLLFSDRLAGAGKGLGEGLRNFKRGFKGTTDHPGSDAAPPPDPAQLVPTVIQAPPKLLPAKGQTTRGSNEPATDGESEERKA